jgi:hypothetical protein
VLLEKSRQKFLADIFKQQLNWRAGGIVGPVSLVAETIFFEVLVLKSLISVNIKSINRSCAFLSIDDRFFSACGIF